jgi:hypothetical protein
MKGVTPIVKMTSGCDYHRVWLPLSEMGMDLFDMFNGKTLGDLIKDTKVIFFNRTCGAGIDSLLEIKKTHDVKIVVDLDDYWELYPNHILYQSWYASGTNKQILDNITKADMVIVTTNLLADKVRPHNKNVHVVPNTLPYDTSQFKADKEESEYLRFLYAGGSSHFRDIQILKIPFQKTLNDPSFKNSKFILAGIDESNQASKDFWKKMCNSFSLNGKLKGFETRGTLPLHSYMNHYRYCDVTIIPLEDNTFNSYKSNLKILESAAKYNPCISSRVSPYIDEPVKDFVDFGHNAATWYDRLKFCAKNPGFVKEAGQALGEYCRKVYHMKDANELRRQLFESLM